VIRRLLIKPATWLVIAILGVAAGAGLLWFQPWRLFTSTTVADPLTPASPPVSGVTSATIEGPEIIRQGTFVTHEHTTTGTARLVRNGDGSHQVRVWLTDQDVGTGSEAWRVFDDGRHLELGRLKGNRGDQVYAVPEDADLRDVRSLSIWCKRFSVSFGAAMLR
jgi:hypothetical protein